MRIILIGGGEVGYALAKSLESHNEVAVVDSNPAQADRFNSLDVEFDVGSGTSGELLRRIHAETSEFVIACTGSDEVNIVACSLASQLGARQTICFVSSNDFLQDADTSEGLRKNFGIGRIVWPEAQLAAAIERIIMAPGAIDAEAFAGGEIRLLEYRLEDRSPLANRTVAHANLPTGVIIVAVKHNDVTSVPHGYTRLTSGDKVVLMGARKAMETLQARVFPKTVTSKQIHMPRLVTIIGGGDVGFNLAQHLEKASGIQLRLIERDQRRAQMLASALNRALILNGDGIDLELLQAEEIGSSEVVVSVIDNDERNLLASLLARQLGVGKIITRVSKTSNRKLFERVGIDVALSAKGAAVASIVHQITGGKDSLLAVLEEGQAKVIELTVPSNYETKALRNFKVPSDSIVGTILRDHEVIVPSGNDKVNPGDRLLVCCTESSEHLVRELFTTERT